MKKAKIFITTLTILIFTLLVNVSFASAETISGTCTHTYSGLQYDTNVSINYDANTKKATVTFSRAYCGFEKALKINDKYNEGDQKAISEGYASSDEKYIAENEPERYSALKNTISN
ncbi:MAG: hypothetical protein MJ246_02480 [Clostridia bacterium]|nr:hypothetical protein [Clostridia bacterium]